MSVTREMKDALKLRDKTGSDEAFRQLIQRRTAGRMARIDAMPKALRECVHDYGLFVVDTLLQAGVTKPKQVRHIVETILDEFSPTRQTRSSQGTLSDYYRPIRPTPKAGE